MHRLPFIIVFLLFTCIVLGQSPHGPSLKIDCAQCHNPEGWDIDYDTIKFDHSSTNFELEGTHEITDCKSCHTTLVFNEAPNDCISCHTDVHTQSVGNDCMRCHTTDNWLVFNLPELHEQNGFPLIGSHSDVSCVECHSSATTLTFTPLGNECIECHRDDYLATQNPNHVTAGFGTDCVECHNPLGFGWDSSGIIHDFFPLTLGHDIDDCSACHNVNDFSDISPECIACHQDDFTATTNPDHEDAGFSTDCTMCHTTNPGWMPAVINHDFFPLTLGHDIEDCNACHIGGNFINTPTDCVACHQDDFQATTNPDHEDAGFPTDCAVCHSTNPGWMPAVINHDFFPLTLGHDIEDCNACHIGGNFNNTPTDCFACHNNDFASTTNPDHEDAGFPTDCAVCHTTNPGWMPAVINHDFFPLTLGHDIEDCNACHIGGNFNNTPTDCFACHNDDFAATTNPDHEDAGFPTDCAVCHTTNPGWMPATVNHDFFPLTLGHDIEDCNACHIGGNFNNTPTDCFACHNDDFASTTNPDHEDAGFPTDCVVCHTTNPGWMPATVNHDFFPLTLGHDIEDCNACHIGGNFNNTPTDCFACHNDDFASTTNPDHEDAGFPTDCIQCHTTNPGWMPATINHDFFPLTLGHDIEDCNACHIGGNFNNTPTECNACHNDDFVATTNPDHEAANFPTDCAQCHTTNPGWMPATFDHNFFPLTLGHDIADCNACHIGGNFNNTPTDCFACHQDDFNATNDPDHEAANFPTDCAQCHTTNPSWMPANFNHEPFFPIGDGAKHDEGDVWTSCTECHINPSNFAVFSCTVCHNAAEEAQTHEDVPAYVYESNACYACHPTGEF